MAQTFPVNRPPGLLHPGLVAAGAALLVAAFVTDILYWQTLSDQWETFSVWLLTGGLVLAALAGLALLLDVALRRLGAMAWWRFAGLVAAALLSLLNAFVHSRDAYVAVMPQGLELSVVVTALLFAVGRRGWSLGAVPSSNPSQPGKAS
jgi:uncharacterized membrane protein